MLRVRYLIAAFIVRFEFSILFCILSLYSMSITHTSSTIRYTSTILIRRLFLYADYFDTLTILIRWLFWYVDYSHMMSNTQSVHSSTRSIFISGLFVWLVCFHLFIRPRFFVKKNCQIWFDLIRCLLKSTKLWFD